MPQGIIVLGLRCQTECHPGEARPRTRGESHSRVPQAPAGATLLPTEVLENTCQLPPHRAEVHTLGIRGLDVTMTFSE